MGSEMCIRDRIDGVSSVTATGLREREIWVEIDPNRLYGLNVSLDLVLARLRQRLVNVQLVPYRPSAERFYCAPAELLRKQAALNR